MKPFFFLLIISLVGSAQSTPVKDAHLINGTAFDATLNTYYILRNDTLISYETEYLREVERKRLKYSDPVILKDQLLAKDSTLYFVSLSGGIVHQLVGDTLVRIDNSFDHKMQINSSFLVHRDTILRYGGYGFWSTRNIFTYFDNRSKEWEAIAPLSGKEVPVGTMKAMLITDDQTIYVLGGLRLDPINPLKTKVYQEAWKFDLDRKVWNYLGELTIDQNDIIYRGTFGDHLIISSSEQMYLLNPKENTVNRLNHSPALKHLFPNSPLYYNDDSFYLLHAKNEGFVLTKSSFDQLFDSVEDAKPLYAEENEIWQPVLITAGIALLFFIGYRVQKGQRDKNKIRVRKNEVQYRGKVLDFDSKSRQVLRALLRAPSGVNSNEILSLVENPEHNQAHNIKVKNQYIESINFKLRALLSLDEDVIRSYKSPIDKRMKVYRIEKKYFI